MKLNKIEPVQVEFMPEKLEQGKLYVSKKYGTAKHFCACGCGARTVTPLKFAETNDEYISWDGGWDYSETDGKITLSPSIGNFSYPCKSHYFIVDNEVRWC